MSIVRSQSFSGKLSAKKISCEKAPLSWRLRNTVRWSFIIGYLFNLFALVLTKVTGIPTMRSRLSIRVHRSDGRWIDYGVVCYRVVTDAGVAYMADDWTAGTPRINDLKYAGCGTGTGNEAAGDTTLGTECTTVLNPDSTRATCTMTQPAAYQVQAVGTLTFDNTAAVTEHGLFSQAATGGGTLWDRSKFDAINVGSGDSVQFTYLLTLTAGG